MQRHADRTVSILFSAILLCAAVALGCSDDPTAPVQGEDCGEEGAVQDGFVCEDGSWEPADEEQPDADAGTDADVGQDAEQIEEECDCEISDGCYQEGETAGSNECLICDPDEADDAFSTVADGTPCDDIDDECAEEQGSCQGGNCSSVPICEGSDADCGCDECVDCTEKDEWVQEGDEYDCCDDGEACVCQDEIFHEYSCDGTECSLEETDERTVVSDCEVCEDNDNDECVDGVCECVPDCDDADCGDDGCGGSCGDCSDDEDCDEGLCVPDECEEDGDCGSSQQCCEDECIPDSDQCDDNGGNGCTSDADCGDFAQCCSDGVCYPNTMQCP